MGRKSSAEEGPVHSPIGRHDANETENTTKQGNTKEPNQTKQSKQNSNQNKTKTLQSDIGPYSTVAKENDFAF